MGYGDDLMITGEVKKLKKIHFDAKFVIGNGTKYWWSEVFSENKSIQKYVFTMFRHPKFRQYPRLVVAHRAMDTHRIHESPQS